MKRKRAEENESKNSKKQKREADRSVFCHMPPELLNYFIVPLIPRTFLYVSKEYNALAAKNLHLDPRVRFDLDSFSMVISNNNRKAVKMHLKYGKLSKAMITKGFDLAFKEDNYKIIKYLVTRDYISNECIYTCARDIISQYASVSTQNRRKIFKLLLRKIEGPEIHSTFLSLSSSKGFTTLCDLIFKYGILDRTYDYSYIFQRMAENNDVQNVRRLLDPQFNVSAQMITKAFVEAIMFRHEDIFDLLAPRVQPNPADSAFLESAIRSNSPNMLKKLLELGICDPMANNAKALHTATTSHSGVARKLTKILLKDPRTDLKRVPTALSWAYNAYTVNTFKLLLEQPDINPLCRDPDSDPMTLSPDYFIIEVVQGMSLLDWTPSPVPEDQKDPTIIDIMLKSFSEVDVHLLFSVLNHPRVNFDYYAGYTIARAMQSKKFHVAQAVLKCPQVHVIDARHRRIAMDCAKKNSLKEIVAKIRELNMATLDFKCS
jgi:hypothetical protein